MAIQRIKVFGIAALLLLTAFSAPVYGGKKAADENKPQRNIVDLIKELKKTVVFIGVMTEEKKPFFYATGFLVEVQDIYHLITAKHVVMDLATGRLKDGAMYIFFNSRDGKVVGRPMAAQKEKFKVDWIFPENPEIDIAVIPFPLDTKQDDVLVVPEDLFTTTDKVFELYDIFFLSYQPGVEPAKKISPVLRSGVISKINPDKTFYIDASFFPGNSGSPVFLKPSPIRFDRKGISLGMDELGGTFVGIVGLYLTYQDVAISKQTGRPRVAFEENTGLAKVWSVECIEEIFGSKAFKKQLARIKKTMPSRR